jgi:hypothetical protein
MAHYAYIDNDNKVVAVIVGKDESELIDGLDTEIYYAKGTEYTVKRTSYNAAINGFRGNYAGIGHTYLPLENIFMPPKCHAEAVLNAKSAKWECTNEDHDAITLAE